MKKIEADRAILYNSVDELWRLDGTLESIERQLREVRANKSAYSRKRLACAKTICQQLKANKMPIPCLLQGGTAGFVLSVEPRSMKFSKVARY